MRFTTAPVVATAVAARRQQRRQRQSLSRARAKQQHPAATETAETNPRLDNIDNSTDIDRTRRDVELRPEGISPLARACGECYHSLSLITLALLVVVAVVVRALKAVFGPVARLCARANHDRSSSGRGQSVLDRDPRRVDDCEVGSATHTLSDPTRFVGGGVKAHCGQAPSGGGGKDSQRPYSVEGTLRVHPHPITNTQGKTTHSRDATAFEVVFEMFPPLTVLPACTTTISAAAACTRGEGSPDVALLLNPTGACKEMWLWTGTVQALLARGFFVVTLDTRGQGRSGAPPDGTPFDCCTVAREEVTQLLTLLGARAVHVLGYSVGAGVAMSLAIDHGQSRSSQSLVKASSTTASITAAAADFTDVVSSASAAVSRRDDPETSEAVLANPTHDDEDGDFGLASVCAFGFTSCYAECRTVAQAMAERALCSRWLVNLVGVAAHGVIIFVLCGYRPTPLDGVRRAIQAANDPGYYARALAAWGKFNITAELKHIAVPILCLHASRDDNPIGGGLRKRQRDVRLLLGRAGGDGRAALITIGDKGSGSSDSRGYSHGLPWENPSLFNKHVCEFFAKHASYTIATGATVSPETLSPAALSPRTASRAAADAPQSILPPPASHS